ncbi:hypothetical protein ACNOYE_01625 [Nannocystaceae bacterium ST9]
MPSTPLVLASFAISLIAFACKPEASEPAEGGGSTPPECTPETCGPKPGMPNTLCDDGVTMSGPGECKANEQGECGWEIVECPASEPGTMCGGIAGIQCPEGQVCVDDPKDSCDPENGGADCGGICQKG